MAATTLLVGSSLLVSGSAEASPSMQSRAALAPQTVLARLFTVHPMQSAWFAPSFLIAVSVSQVQSIGVSLTGELGAFTRVDALGNQTFRVRFLDGTVQAQMHLDEENRIGGLLFTDPELTVPPASAYRSGQALAEAG
jgi:hypothetical protein